MLNRVQFIIKTLLKNNNKYTFTKSKSLYNENKTKNMVNLQRNCNYNKITTRKMYSVNNSFNKGSNKGPKLPSNFPKIGLIAVLTVYFINKNNKKNV